MGRLAWYFEPPAQPGRFAGDEDLPKAWLCTGAVRGVRAFDAQRMVRLPMGGYLENNDAKVFHLPISKIDLPGGKEQPCLLSLPFQGQIDAPSTNYSGSGGTITTHGPYMLAITGLNVNAGKMDVTVGTESSAATLVFPLQ